MKNNDFNVLNEGNHNSNGNPHNQYENMLILDKYLVNPSTKGFYNIGQIRIPKLLITSTDRKLELYYKLNILRSLSEDGPTANSLNMKTDISETYLISIIYPCNNANKLITLMKCYNNTPYGTLFLEKITTDTLYDIYNIYLYLDSYQSFNVKISLNINNLNAYKSQSYLLRHFKTFLIVNDNINQYTGDYSNIIKEKVQRNSYLNINLLPQDITNKVIKIFSATNITNYQFLSLLELFIFINNYEKILFNGSVTSSAFSGQNAIYSTHFIKNIVEGTNGLYYTQDTSSFTLYIDVFSDCTLHLEITKLIKSYTDIELPLIMETSLIDKTEITGLTAI